MIFTSPAELDAAVGTHIGTGEWFAIEQDRIDGFADATEDHQWIHVDPGRAASGPFGAPIAHGFLTLSLIPFLARQAYRLENTRMGINYGLNKVRFPTPVKVGSRVRASVELVSADEVAGSRQIVARVTIELEGSDKPACVAETVTRVYF